ncbi:MAG TPA: SulP family inorganic anion transporter [Anaerolineales bacterium]|nr:SulP family inorganic anion transporter [Anaerolineales bacterium]
MMNLKDFQQEFRPRILLPSITAGLIASIITISLEISLAALIFSGDLSRFLAGGIGLMLFGAFAMGIAIALTTSLPGMIGFPQDTPAAILALVTASIAARMEGSDPEAIYATVIAALSFTSVLTAAFFLLLGWFKSSSFVRYIPYPVVGGFLAGTGWLLALGGFNVMTNLPLSLLNLPQIFSADMLVIWIPGIIFAIALLVMLRRSTHFLITPGVVLLATLLFYVFLFAANISVAEASARGWLLGPFPSGGLYQPLTLSTLGLINWQVIFQNIDKIATILVLSIISLLLNASALEVTVKKDIDLNRELQTAGWANLFGGLGGSPVGYQTLGMSALAHRLGAKSRLVNLISASVCGVALFFGASLISYFPKPVLGGMLFYLGLSFLVEWLVDARRSLPLLDYLLVWVILIIIAVVGFLQGIIAGIFIAAILFVISYSRINAIKTILDGSIYHSKVDRPKLHRDILHQKGSEIFILRLQGYIFFGTIQSILEKIRLRLSATSQEPLKFLIIDFHRVPRLDSSAVFGITRLKQLTRANNLLMVWTEVSVEMIHQLERGGHIDKHDDSFVIMPSLDEGVEWCENKILANEGMADLTGFIESVETQLKRLLPGIQGVDRLMKYLERREVDVGEYLMKQNEPSEAMYFVESGLVSVELELPNQKRLRVRSIRGGATVGEMGIYLEGVRTASVVASRRSVVYRLSLQALKEMREKDPEIAALFHEWIARLLAERIADNNRMFEALMD